MKSATAFIQHLTTAKWDEAHNILQSLQQQNNETADDVDTHTRNTIAKYADWHSRTVLHFALKHADCMPPASLIQDLVEVVGVYTACCDSDGRTPLAYACRFVSEFSSTTSSMTRRAHDQEQEQEARHRHQELLDILTALSQNCQMTGQLPALVADKHDRVPLHVICISTRPAFDYNNTTTQFEPNACSVYLKHTVQMMLQSDHMAARVLDEFQRLPLHYAFLNSIPIPLVKMIVVAHPAALHMCDCKGNAPMHYLMSTAKCHGNEAYIASVLDVLSCSIDSDIFSAALMVQNGEKGCTPIHVAIGSYLSDELLCKLLQCEPKVAHVACTVYGDLPIHAAIRSTIKSMNDYSNLIAQLVSCASSSLMRQDRQGRTPLLLAALSSARLSVETMRVIVNGDLGAIHVPCKMLGIAPLEQLWAKRPPGMALIQSFETIEKCPQLFQFWSKLELLLYASYGLYYCKYDGLNVLPPPNVMEARKYILHAASIAPTPETLLRSLLHLFPDQASERSEADKKLPYQLAIDSGKSQSCVRLILQAFPQAISVEEVHPQTLANILSQFTEDDDGGIDVVYKIVQSNPDICNVAAREENIV
mmetsp:Transcript_27974/g.43477  ORF Transcript_27974/g.43477 Transcript_27974/m.43477 type:complete len:591 (-) Transcript_27974:109-1881(-)|eukprot:CAMPEP_0196821956 /NCGR_PEP_ID=MMETSP1362-20130617/81652_1 /TAXON_ID=163516 /ORGANISM="Leptocylindrus danicus, Strain CCMP1856" /LENGTH=590 /DNA_ID=CAMNT_0042201353 /DNA_START=165 /DNA_END=1937 /DNA_ORIENTATION=-